MMVRNELGAARAKSAETEAITGRRLRCVVCFLGMVLGTVSESWAQSTEDLLKIEVRQGGNTGADIHLPADKVGKTLEVRVLNEVDLPQSGAKVVFEAVALKESDAAADNPADPAKKKKKKKHVSALTADGKPRPVAGVYFGAKDITTASATSDADGVVRVTGVFGNKVVGASTIQITATFEGKSGHGAIPQLNDRGPLLSPKQKIAVAGALAATGVILYEVLKPGPPSGQLGSPSTVAK